MLDDAVSPGSALSVAEAERGPGAQITGADDDVKSVTGNVGDVRVSDLGRNRSNLNGDLEWLRAG